MNGQGRRCSGSNPPAGWKTCGIRRATTLRPLKGDREGQHSLRINDQWRLVFRWEDGNAHDVAIVDYHD